MAKKPISIQRHRHECAIRQLLAWRKEWGLQKFREYCHTYTFYPKWITLQDDFVIQWRLGNRGNKDHWIG
jgi:hypothetical protein